MVGSCVSGRDWAAAYAASESYVSVGSQRYLTLLKQVPVAGVGVCEVDIFRSSSFSIAEMPLEITSFAAANASLIPLGTVGDERLGIAARVVTVDCTAVDCVDNDVMSVVQ